LEARGYIGGRIYSDATYGDLGPTGFHVDDEFVKKQINDLANFGSPFELIEFALNNKNNLVYRNISPILIYD
jgi:hypothetical protein